MLNEEQKKFAGESLKYWKNVIWPLVNNDDKDWRMADFPWGIHKDPLCKAYFIYDRNVCGAGCPFVIRKMNCFSDNSPFDLIRLARGFGHNKAAFKKAVKHYMAYLRYYSDPKMETATIKSEYESWKKRLMDLVAEETKLDDDIRTRKQLKVH